MEYLELKAEVFKTIKANGDKTAMQIHKIIKRDFEKEDQAEVSRAIHELTG
jgi:hypothetical protein